MGKKGLVSIFSRLAAPSSTAASPPWPWPPCGTNPQTASFRLSAPDNDGDGDSDEPCCTATATATATAAAPEAGAGGGNKLMAVARGAAPGEMYKTVNSVYLDDPAADDFFSLAFGDDDGAADDEALHDDDGFSTTTASEEWSEAVIRSLGSRTSTDRFFFDPPGPLPASNSILATATTPYPEPPARKEALPAGATTEAKTTAVVVPDDCNLDDEDARTQQPHPRGTSPSLAERSVAVAVDSGDPYGDFRASMEEMVSAHGLRDWAALEELLEWYLRINGKQQHHLIVGAFVDLLMGLSSSSSSSSSSSPPSTAAETTTTTTTGTTTSSSSTTTSSSRCARAGSRRCASTTSASAGDAAATALVVRTVVTTAGAAVVEVEEQCGGGNEVAPCSSSSSSSYRAATADVHQVDVEEEEEASAAAAGSDGDRVRATGSAPLRRRRRRLVA